MLGTVGWLVDSVCLALIELVVVFLCARVYLYLAALYVVFIHLYLEKKVDCWLYWSWDWLVMIMLCI